MLNFKKFGFGCSAIAMVAALSVAMPAVAQEAEPAAVNEDGIDVIVITARRQQESAQSAAIAIDAVSGDDLAQAGILDAQDLRSTVPALTLANGGAAYTSILIRGVGNIANNAYLDAAVTPSVDGVVTGRGSGAFGAAFFDMSRVEVLKGPQGILYGRNATGGAINIIPNRPEIGVNSAGFSAGYGNFDAISFEGFVNVGASNGAMRVAFSHQEHDGYNRDGSDDLDRSSIRAQFLAEPTDNLSIRVSGDYTRMGGVGPGSSYIGHFSGPNFIAAPTDNREGMDTPAADAYRQTVLGAPGFGFLNPMNEEQSLDFEFYGVHAEIELETDIGTFTVIPAYRVMDGDSYFYGPAFSTAYNKERDAQYSLEARLAGSAGPVDYVLGGFYFNEDSTVEAQFNQEFVLPMQEYVSGTESLAGFGQLTFNVTDQARLVGGLRYTNDQKYIDGTIINFIAFCGLPPSPNAACRAPGVQPHFPNFTQPQAAFDWLISQGFIAANSVYNPTAPVQVYLNQRLPIGRIQKTYTAPNDSGSYSKLTWKVGAEYDVTPDNLLYATVETGYRAGGFQLATGNTTYDPENITAYSIGSKNRFLDDRLQLNLEAFWWKYRDQQVTYFTIDVATSTLVSLTDNVGRSEIRGADLDLIYKPMRNTTLSGKVQYLDTEYQELFLITAAPRDNYECPRSNTGQLTNTGSPVIRFDCSGRPLIFSPEWSVNLGVEQVFEAGDFDVILNANTSWRSSQYTQFNFLDFQLVPSYWVSNANLTLANVDAGWSVSAYVNNIEGNRQVSFAQASPIGFAVARYTSPRTYGLRVSSSF